MNENYWKVVRLSDFGFTPVMRAIWSLKHKIIPRKEIIKYKSRTSAHGRTQRWGESYHENHESDVN